MLFLRSLAARLSHFFGGGTHHTLKELIRVSEFEKVLQYSISDYGLFYEALSHRSYIPAGASSNPISNERLEFLGDSVLNLLVAEYLFNIYTTAPEGELTKIRARLVNRKALSMYAKDLGLENFLLMSSQAEHVSGRGLETILADAFEAIIGAIYLDSGHDQTRAFVERTVVAPYQKGLIGSQDENYKSRLLEFAQADGIGVPRYVTVGEIGPDHDRTFTIEVIIGKTSFGIGTGKNKKDAEQAAALNALKALQVPL